MSEVESVNGDQTEAKIGCESAWRSGLSDSGNQLEVLKVTQQHLATL